ncbi:MAG: response regulator transcription factor [Burkholderiaceae bacterium]
MHVLIIEDNPDILANLYGFLEPLGYTLDSARSGYAGLSLADDGVFDAIVLDLSLPGLDGLDICRQLRTGRRCITPILMLTARDSIHDKVAGFESGADDYLVKPFSMVELDLRLHALVRRAKSAVARQVMRVGDLTFDPGTFQVKRAGQSVQLTPTGYKLLNALIRAAPNMVSRSALEREVWGDAPPDSDALRSHIHALRQAIDKPFSAPVLKTIQGVGFRLSDPHDD